MERPEKVSVAPSIDPLAIRKTLTAIYKTHGDADAARPHVLALLREAHRESHVYAEAELLKSGDGRRCAAYLSETMDQLVGAIFDYAASHVYYRSGDAASDQMAIAATGGYGRGLLAPGSDVDLLFLLPYKQTAWGESVVEFILYLLWDLGLKVGHATRTVDQCVRLSGTDFTIRSALLDARLIHGDASLFGEFESRFRADVTRSSARAFIEAKMRERDTRHDRTGQSRFLVEPNVKDGKGGLRDLHTLHWLTMYLKGIEPDQVISPDENGKGGHAFLSAAERATYRRCEDFLWTVRCHLHFVTGRPEERLGFDLQPVLAERLRYRESGGMRAVERFMKHYFMIAKNIGDLTRIISSVLELEQLKTVPRLPQFLNPASWTARRQIRKTTEFRIENERINIIDPNVFRRDPLNLFRIFKIADETGSLFHPEAFRQMRRSARLIDDKVRQSPEAARLFLDLLSKSAAPHEVLRRMHGVDVLGRFMPEFRQVTAMMQFNMYHHFTVDEHLLRTVMELRAIEDGAAAAELPLSTKLFADLKSRRLLYVAGLIHDIGKGRAEDHSILGARMARRIATRLALTSFEVETIVWLIREHLTMSLVAQNRDLSDPRTSLDFAETCGTMERMNLLLLLTVADIRAVGPGTWNGWKGSLLRQLYFETANHLTDDDAPLSMPEQIAAAQSEFRAALKDWPDDLCQRVMARHYDEYWLRTDLETQLAHAELLKEVSGQEKKFAITFTTDAFTEITQLRVVAPNHPRLLSVFAGCCAATSANIIGAQITTTRDGLVLDDFQLQRAFPSDADETRRTDRIAQTIERVLLGKVRLADELANQDGRANRRDAFDVEPEVTIDNTVSDQFTVIDVAGLDRPRLLYDLTSALSDLSLDINSARINTFGERAVDAFYVTDLTSKKIAAPDRKEAIRERLLRAVVGKK